MSIKLQNTNNLVMVDDSDIDIMLMKRFVKKSDLKNEFISFSSGEKFLDYMEQFKQDPTDMPALILLDINMPGMNGFEVLEALRDSTEFKELPVVTFLSNSNSPSDFDRCRELNAGMQEKFSDTDKCVVFLNSLIP